jgi:hypothetical protein
LRDARTVEALTDAGVSYEADALAALASESSDAAGAREAWRRYLEGPGGKGPWAANARGREGTVAARKGEGKAR